MGRVGEDTGRSRIGKGTRNEEERSREGALVYARKTIALYEVRASAIRDCLGKKGAGWPPQKWSRTVRFKEEQRV